MIAPMHSSHVGDDRFDDYVDNLLDPRERNVIEAHLIECADCAGRLDELRALLAITAAERRPVEPPAELWPLVVASTVERPRLRRQLLRTLRAPLVAAALVLVVLSSATTAWVLTRAPAAGAGVVSLRTVLAESATLDRSLAALDHEHGPVPQDRVRELRRQLAEADAAVRRALSNEALYRALADRERIVTDIRAVLGRGPKAPRPPAPRG